MSQPANGDRVLQILSQRNALIYADQSAELALLQERVERTEQALEAAEKRVAELEGQLDDADTPKKERAL